MPLLPTTRYAAALLAGLTLAACSTLPREPLAEADAAMRAMIEAGQMPGGVLWIEHEGRSYHRAYGLRALRPAPEPLDEATVFDAASLTKAVVTAPLVQLLREQGRLDLEAPLTRYLPECRGFEAISLRMLLTHSSGLPAGLPRLPAWSGTAGAIEQACRQTPSDAPGTQFRYSDINYILLGEIVARVGGRPLQDLARESLFAPLGMADSGYLPLQRLPAGRIAPTQEIEGRVLRGEVHDPTARRMGGVAGHAGLFTTAADLARFARMLLNGGLADDGRRLLSAASVALMSTPQQPGGVPEVRRGMGWDIDSIYSRPRGRLYPRSSFGHTGFTGCAFWLDPGSRSFYILLANRVHPGHPTNTLPLYEQLGSLSARAAGLGAR